jgi:hypothetical protein
MTHLTDKAVLVHLSLGHWTGRKLDRKATQDVLRANGAKDGVGRFHKSLLPACDTLDSIKRKAIGIRKNFFYRNTLPWGIQGTYILPTKNYMGFTEEYRQHKGEYLSLRSQFLSEYEVAVQSAASELGTLYDTNDYPPVHVMEKKFHIDLDVMPVPTQDDFRVDLANEEYERIQAKITERVEAAQQAAIKDVWDRLYKRVLWIAEKLADADKQIQDRTFDDARQDCDLLKRLNFADDPELDAMIARVQDKIFDYHPDTLKFDPDVREQADATAKDVLSKMGAFMGGMA